MIKITSAILVLVLIFPILAGANLELDALRENERAVNEQIDVIEKTLAKEQADLETVVSETTEVALNIERITLELEANEKRIFEFNRTIAEREAELLTIKQNLSSLVRDLEVAERANILALILNNDSLSGALRETEQKQLITENIGQRYGLLVAQTEQLNDARDQLELTKLALASARISLDVHHQALAQNIAEQTDLVKVTRNALNGVAQQRVALRSQIFAVAADSNSRAISLEEAIGYARLAAERLKNYTGQEISAPFLLSIVRHESNFGNYLGKGHYSSAMCSQSQIEAFVFITQELGLDPETTPVSKPAKNQSCGGAMGYAQFLPRTWLAYADKVAELTGHAVASPWNPEDAFTAVALKLAANGATRGATFAEKRRAQWEAAMTYFSGSRWRDPGVLKNISRYGTRALDTADAYAVIIGQ